MENRPYGNAYKVAMIQLGETVINGSENASIQSGIEKQFVMADGAMMPRTTYISGIAPTIPFSSMNLDTFLRTGWLGLPLDQIEGGMSIYLELLQPNASIWGGSKHLKWRCTEGIIYPTQLQIATDGVVSGSYTISLASKDQKWPLEATDGQSLPALGDITCYGLGPTIIDDFHLNTVADVGVDFQPNVQPFKRDGDIYPRCFHVPSAQPRLTFNLADVSIALDEKLGRAGTAEFATTMFYLQRRMRGGEYFPGTDPVHAKIQFAGEYFFPTLADGNSTDLASTQLQVDVVQQTADVANNFVVTPNVVIPNNAWPQEQAP